MTENKINHNLSWEGVCVIGLGNHAKNKLIPGLEASGHKVLAVVSRNPAVNMSGVQNFLTVTDAVSSLPKSTLFVIATPPNFHYVQVKEVIEAGRDVFVEKPAFLSHKDTVELCKLASDHNVILVEMLMYLENDTVQWIIDELKCKSGLLKNIECQFLIPSVPPGTFRNESSLGNSLLSDMACYPLSLLAMAGFDLSNFVLVSDNVTKKNPIFYIKGNSQQTNIYIRVGLNGQYRNEVKLLFEDDRQVSCEPFFYGREGYRKFRRVTNSRNLIDKVYETNAYERMFARKRSEWLLTQQNRCDALCLVSDSLERLAMQAGMF